MSDSLWPHGLYSPWNSSGQNTGVGSHSLLQGIFPTQGSNPGLPHCRQILYQLSRRRSPIYDLLLLLLSRFSRVWLCATPCSPWSSPGQNTGVGSLSLLQEIFPIQGSNPGLPHCRQILYQLSRQGSQGEVPVLLMDIALFRATIWCCYSCILTIKAIMDILKRQNWNMESTRCCDIVYPLN